MKIVKWILNNTTAQGAILGLVGALLYQLWQ
jgi:hypothetical protein